jgi:hypothetical protein
MPLRDGGAWRSCDRRLVTGSAGVGRVAGRHGSFMTPPSTATGVTIEGAAAAAGFDGTGVTGPAL